MLGESTVIATVAVSDIEKAKEFYGGTLGLKQIDENPGGVAYASGTGQIFVYPSQYAATNKATCADWEVEDIKKVIQELKTKGVSFERYDFPGVEYDGDVHIMEGMKAAWFKDPDGNILGLSSPV